MRQQLALWCLSAAAYALLANASPEPGAGITVAAYPTTRTRVWSTTSTSTNVVMWINPRIEIYVTILTVTILEPGPASAGAVPVTIPQVAITSGTIRTTISPTGDAAAEMPASTVWAYTSTETWLVSRPEATFLPAGVRGEGIPCADGEVCAREQSAGDDGGDGVCKGAGMHTGCLGQCEERDGLWWCYRMWQREWDVEGGRLRMGRACWGEGGRFRQLNVPCRTGDVRVGCAACKGADRSWGSVVWEGPG